uniref:Reverse transcriptase domain-containing protein n=1 Tax=Tanacetum cinerariifolium TaxID=118510 RepID=A0A6L2LM55_TANCI|nr:reverse transcriptase domain-containing protein [Tanacetum cinerariifolium]
MTDNRTMAEMLRAPIEGCAEAIVVPPILAEQFNLKHSLINMMTSEQFFGLEKDNLNDHIRAARQWLEKEPPHSITTWDDLVSKFINEFFPPLRTTNHRNEILNFQQKFDESFHEAWERYKDLLRACPHQNFTELHQLDTFYNALNPADQDSLNAAAGGNLLEKSPQDALTIIKNKSKQTSAVTIVMMAMLKQLQANPPPAYVKAVEEIYVTCRGAHPYYQCLVAGGNTFLEFRDNIQGYVSAAAGNYNQGNPGYRPQGVANQMRPPGFAQPNVQNNPNRFGQPQGFNRGTKFNQEQPYQATAQSNQNFHLNELEKIKRMNDVSLKAMQNQIDIMNTTSTLGSRSLPGNTIANPKGKLKAIATRSRIVTDGPTVPTPPKSITLEEDECVKETYTDPDLAEYTIKVPPPPEKLQELANTPLNENCSAVILKKLPEKLGDPGKFLIPCGFSELNYNALADLRANINLMPLSVWKMSGLHDLIPTRITLELANYAICTPDGIARDVFVPVGKFTFPADFVVDDYESDPRVPLILGRPFLRTARALIDFHDEEMILHDGDERLTLNMKHDTTSYSNHPHRESVNVINIFNISSEDCLEVSVSNQKSGNPTFSLHKEIASPEVIHEIHDTDGCTFLSEELLDIDSFNDIHPHFNDNPLSGSTTYSSNLLLEEFTDELALITYPPYYDDNLKCDIEFDLKEIEFFLYQGEDSNLKDSIDQTDLANLDDYFVNPTPEMFDVVASQDFSRDDDLPSPDNEDKDFDPPFYELLIFNDVPNLMRLLPFSSKNEEKVFKPGIYTSEKAPIEGYGKAIVIPKILAENFEIKTNSLQLVHANKFHGFKRDNPHTHIINFKRMTAILKYKDVPNDAIKLMLFSYSLEGVARVWDNVSKTDDRIDKLADLITNLVEIVNKQVIAPAKAVEKTRVTCGGAHAYYECIATDSNPSSVCAETGSYNQVSPPNRASHQIPPPGFALVQNNPNRFNQNQGYRAQMNNALNFQNQGLQNPPFPVPNNHIPPSIPNEFSSYIKSNEIMIKSMQNQINVLRGDFNKYEENLRRKLNNDMRSILESFFQNQPSTSGTLLSNTVPTPKGEIKVVTTRSGLAYEGPSIPTSSPLEKVDEQNTKEIFDKEHSNSSGSTAQVQPPAVPISIPEPDVSRTQTKPSIPYPFSFADALFLMPKFVSTIKSLLANKDKLSELAKVSLNENCSAMLLKKLPEKLGDPELTPTRMTLELADRSITHPKGVAEDVFVKVGKFHFPTDFVVVDFEADPRVSIILGRYFLRTGHVLINVYGEEITLGVNDESITFNLNQTMRYSLTYDDTSVNRVDVIDIACEDFVQDVLDFQYNPKSSILTLVFDDFISKSDACKEPIVKSSLPTLTPFRESDLFLKEIEDFLNDDSIPTRIKNSVYDPEGDILFLEKLLNEDPFQLPPIDLKLAEESKEKSFVEEPPELELKELPSHLGFYTHKILIEDDYKPAVQSQRRVDPKIHDVIKKEVIKLLDVERAVGENHTLWSDKLDDALWAFRTAYMTLIGCTPYKLVYGKSCHLLIELEHMAYWVLKHVSFYLKTAGDHRKLQLNELSELRDQAYENSVIYKERAKKLHDSKIKNRIFNVGDQVLLFNSRFKIFSGKLKTRWSGPFTITRVFPYGTIEYLNLMV